MVISDSRNKHVTFNWPPAKNKCKPCIPATLSLHTDIEVAFVVKS